jgi:hypothetical protein
LGIVTEMSEIETVPKILASLRIGSDDYDLSTIAPFLGIPERSVCRKGDRRIVGGVPKYALFHRNFANSDDRLLPRLEAINPWLSCRLGCIERAASVPALLQSGMIEVTLWIFMGGYPADSIPAVDPAVRQRAAKLNVTIYFEHYFDRESNEKTGLWPTRLAIKHNTDAFIE